MKKRVLVVDDDELVLTAIAELLGTRGFIVEGCTSAKEALEKVEKQDFDLMILDIIMPEMDGFELCKRLREIEQFCETPIIMLTAKTSEEDRKRGLEVGANLYVTKPISPQRLLELVEDILA
ncbi:MAG TPA: response regulator [Proteobacteria bacterium]|nr:response regulator [Pseudomonadota bacterium]